MITRFALQAFVLAALATSGYSQLPEVIAVKQFSGISPSSSSLQVPFHGCVTLDRALPTVGGEYWLTVDHLVKDNDFSKIQMLVNAGGIIIGARASFTGSLEEWNADRGYASRKRVLEVFLGGDGPELSRKLPLAYDGCDFGDMVYTFDIRGNVSWRKAQGVVLVSEAEYVSDRESHKKACEECKNIRTSAVVVLPQEKNANKSEQATPRKPSD